MDVLQPQGLVRLQGNRIRVLCGEDLHLDPIANLGPPGGIAQLLQGFLPLRGAGVELGSPGVIGDGVAKARGLGPAVFPEGVPRLFQPPALGGHGGEVILHVPVVIQVQVFHAALCVFHSETPLSPVQCS